MPQTKEKLCVSCGGTARLRRSVGYVCANPKCDLYDPPDGAPLTAGQVAVRLRAEATRLEAAARQQDHMAEWTSDPAPGQRSREFATVLRLAADMIANVEA